MSFRVTMSPEGDIMETQNFSIRLKTEIVKKLDEVATQHEWSRNYVISKFLKEKIYELTGEC